MLKRLLIVLFSLSVISASAQTSDSLFTVRKGNSWAIKYVMRAGETLHMLAKRFYITDVALEYANDYQDVKKYVAGATINIPVTPDNYSVNKQTFSGQCPLYYRVAAKDDMGVLSTYAGVTKDDMRKWNNLKGYTIIPGQTLFIGWVKIVPRDSANPASEVAYVLMKKGPSYDTSKFHILGGLDTAYNRQTNNGTNVLTEKGTAVFFDKQGKNNIYYAFHNTAARESVIKVYNPGMDKTIYVRVLGPIPNTKQFANCIIGISSAAKAALGVTESKAWCELTYSAN